MIYETNDVAGHRTTDLLGPSHSCHLFNDASHHLIKASCLLAVRSDLLSPIIVGMVDLISGHTYHFTVVYSSLGDS